MNDACPLDITDTREVPSGHLLHADCGQRLRYAKHCPAHGAVDSAAIVRGYEHGPDRHVIVEPEELDQLHPSQDRALRLERFLAPAQLDPVLYSGRSLYLVPDGPVAEPGYVVLHPALVQRQRWALGRMVLGGHRQADKAGEEMHLAVKPCRPRSRGRSGPPLASKASTSPSKNVPAGKRRSTRPTPGSGRFGTTSCW
jgi:hypothetical protein